MKTFLTKKGIIFAPKKNRTKQKTIFKFGKLPLAQERITMSQRAMRLAGKLQEINEITYRNARASKSNPKEIQEATMKWKEINSQVDCFFTDSVDGKKIDAETAMLLRHELIGSLSNIFQNTINLSYYHKSPETEAFLKTIRGTYKLKEYK